MLTSIFGPASPLQLSRGIGDELFPAALQALICGQLLPGHAVRQRVLQHPHKQVRVGQPCTRFFHVRDRACIYSRWCGFADGSGFDSNNSSWAYGISGQIWLCDTMFPPLMRLCIAYWRNGTELALKEDSATELCELASVWALGFTDFNSQAICTLNVQLPQIKSSLVWSGRKSRRPQCHDRNSCNIRRAAPSTISALRLSSRLLTNCDSMGSW